MGLLEMANIPYVGCDVPSSVLAMDKVLAKLMAEAHGIATPAMQFATSTDYARNPKPFIDAIEHKLDYPLFVKPAHLGSSIGISRVANREDLENALEVAFHYDDKVLAEEAVANLIEVTVPIMGNDEPQPALVEQPLVDPDSFFDFETKYMNQGKGGKKTGGKQGAQGYSNLPADISKDLYEESLKTATAAYRALGCKGIARIDLLINAKTNHIYFNEVNPLPGSLYVHNWRAAGFSGVELVTKLIEYAREAHEKKQKVTTSFSTNFLQQF
jgi:D-alanine-D-alanine ligase